MLTIGEFARASRLTAKALRLYDELGLLCPARVDPDSGYRFYTPDQIERARLVAWLRRLGMPLARIRLVCDAAGPAAAAAEVAAFWAQAEADLASRRDLAAFLVCYLTGRDPVMSVPRSTMAIRYAAASDTGRRRPVNQDAAYASSRLLAVADGMGSAGARASAAAIAALRRLDTPPPAASPGPGIPSPGDGPAPPDAAAAPDMAATPGTDVAPGAGGGAPAGWAGPGDLLNALAQAAEQASAAVRGIAAADPVLDGSGTTLTALLWAGSQLALVHIGDTRAYLLRDGELFRITHDHTVVQSLIDEGRLTPEEAVSHPQRALLLRALGGPAETRPDLSLHEARAGDRYLLCSDGLTTVVAAGAIGQVLRSVAEPEAAVQRLIGLANAAGGPDNVACVVADLVETGAGGAGQGAPGSAADLGTPRADYAHVPTADRADSPEGC